MLNKNLQQQLEAMPNKTFKYAGSFHYIRSVKIDDEEEKVTIVTQLSNYTRNFDSIPEFVKYWELAPTQEEEKPVKHSFQQPTKTLVPEAPKTSEFDNQVIAFMEKESSIADNLIEVLKENIAKVKESADYIPQATAINNNVNSIINISKMKMDFVRSMKNRR